MDSSFGKTKKSAFDSHLAAEVLVVLVAAIVVTMLEALVEGLVVVEAIEIGTKVYGPLCSHRMVGEIENRVHPDPGQSENSVLPVAVLVEIASAAYANNRGIRNEIVLWPSDGPKIGCF